MGLFRGLFGRSGPQPFTGTIPEEVRSFLEGLIADVGVAADAAAKEDLVRVLFSKLDYYLVQRMVRGMSGKDADEFIRLNEAHAAKAQIDQFMRDHLPQGYMAEAFADFREYYLDVIARKQPRTQAALQQLLRTSTPNGLRK